MLNRSNSFDLHMPSMLSTTPFLKDNEWTNPQNPSKSPFQSGRQTKQSIFEFLAENPDFMAHFHNALAASNDFGLYRAVQELPWLEIIDPTESGDVTIVDVGGADGSVLRQI